MLTEKKKHKLSSGQKELITEKDLEEKKSKRKILEGTRRVALLDTFQRKADCDLSHIARGSASTIFQELAFVKDLAFITAMPTHTLISLCLLGNIRNGFAKGTAMEEPRHSFL